MSPRRMTPGAYRFLEWGTATSDPRSRVFDHAGAMIFTGSTVRRAGSGEDTSPGRVIELVDAERVRVAWADGATGTDNVATLRAVSRPEFGSDPGRT